VITLYHCVSAHSFRVLWMLEELAAPYELKMLPFPPRMQQRSYFRINPLGTVPTLLDGDTRMSESAAICQYLAVRFAPTPLNVEPGESDFGAFLNDLHFGEATLTFPQMLVLRYARHEPEVRRSAQVADDYTKWFLARLRTLEPRLAVNEYLCAARFTAADVSVGYALLLAKHLDLVSRFPPAVAAYWQRLQARAAFLRALRVQDEAALAQNVSQLPAPELRG
jgi:glutathione S-transferase